MEEFSDNNWGSEFFWKGNVEKDLVDLERTIENEDLSKFGKVISIVSADNINWDESKYLAIYLINRLTKKAEEIVLEKNKLWDLEEGEKALRTFLEIKRDTASTKKSIRKQKRGLKRKGEEEFNKEKLSSSRSLDGSEKNKYVRTFGITIHNPIKGIKDEDLLQSLGIEKIKPDGIFWSTNGKVHLVWAKDREKCMEAFSIISKSKLKISYKSSVEDQDISGRIWVSGYKDKEKICDTLNELVVSNSAVEEIRHSQKGNIAWIEFHSRQDAKEFMEITSFTTPDGEDLKADLTKWRIMESPDELMMRIKDWKIFLNDDALREEIGRQFENPVYWVVDQRHKVIFFNFMDQKINEEACGSCISFNGLGEQFVLEIEPAELFNHQERRNKKNNQTREEKSWQKEVNIMNRRMDDLGEQTKLLQEKMVVLRRMDVIGYRLIDEIKEEHHDSVRSLERKLDQLSNDKRKYEGKLLLDTSIPEVKMRKIEEKVKELKMEIEEIEEKIRLEKLKLKRKKDRVYNLILEADIGNVNQISTKIRNLNLDNLDKQLIEENSMDMESDEESPAGGSSQKPRKRSRDKGSSME